MNYWLFKSEPSCFSIEDLSRRPNQTSSWDGVRNYQVRNLLRDEIKVGDLAFFYHSSCQPPGMVGVMKVVKNGYPDHTAWDSHNEHYDPNSTPDHPRWYMVDVKLVQIFPRIITLNEIKSNSQLNKMAVTKKGNRLSITRVTPAEWRLVLKIAGV